MATSNEIIRDELIQHQVELLRFSRGMARRLIAILNRGEPELRARLRARLERASRLGLDPGPATTRRLAVIERQIRVLLDHDWRQINKVVRGELTQLAGMEVGFLRALLVGSLPVVVDPVVLSAARLRQIVTHTPISGTPLSRLLAAWQTADRRRIMDQVRTGLLFSETPLQISRRIFGTRKLRGTDGVRQITRRGAQTMANTAMSAITNQTRRVFAEANRDLIRVEIYIATLDVRTTMICASLDGRRFPVGEGPHPPLHPNCRSLRGLVVDGRRLGRRPAVAATERNLAGLSRRDRARRIRELVGQVPAEVDYETWLRGRSVAFQNEAIGRTKAILFRRGGLSLDRFVDASGNEYTIDELMAREARAFRMAGL